ncbi:MAG: M28 family metallopeptidase [Acidobacteriota bacterium]
MSIHIPMKSGRGGTLGAVMLAVAVSALACMDQPAASPQAAPASPRAASTEAKTTPFDGEKAFAHARAQVDFGPRPAGSAAIEKTREYLVRELKSYGLKVTVDEFSPTTPLGKLRMKNVIAELPGDSRGVVIISSHYDTKPFKEFSFVGANDGGSSTGALLEIARVLAAGGPRRWTYQFVFFDGEEAFCKEWSECLDGNDNTYGSRHYVERLKAEKRVDQIKTMILLDMIGDKDLTIPRQETSTGWLVDIIWGVAAELGHIKEFPSRTFAIGDDDHLPFLRAGIAAVDIIDFEYGQGREDHSYWHTAEDTLDKISSRSLKIVGDTVLASLPKIDARIR